MNESSNRTVFVIIGVLLLVFLIASAGGGKPKTKPPPPPKPLDNARAVVLTGGDGVDRTIVVPPCNAPASSDRQEGSVTLEMLAAPAGRVVLVPDCLTKRDAGFRASSETPSAAFVLPVGSQAPTSPTLKVGAQTQVLVPSGSRAATVVVPPCTGAAAKKDVVLSPAEGKTTGTAQPC